ncbi:muscular LMNA-interacting protein isoform X2 [Bombina bombina]|uniref:muscular LMNA-interacting protein isoform X2 n=2 Tax=Bombina bombina TaxID=8345 RepID=UPI00235A6612|nr:muscular LMNA-interacting protein isoform X2 [Bombina bombina]
MNTKYYNKNKPVEFTGMNTEISTVNPETNSLTFSFVPTYGTLPTQVLVGKNENFIPKVQKNSVNWEKEMMDQKPNYENVSEKSISMEDESPSICHKRSNEQIFLGRGLHSNTLYDMKQNDLFIAEFVLVEDFEEDEEITKKNNETMSCEEGYESSGTQVSATPEPAACISEVLVNELYVLEEQHENILHNIDCKEKELQLNSCVTTADYGPYNSKDSYSLNQQFKCLNYQIPGRHEYVICNSPANIKDTTTKNSFPNSNKLLPITSPLLNIPNTNMASFSIPTQMKVSDTSTVNTKISSPDTCYRSKAMSPLPVQVIKHSLSPSPTPLQSKFYGSSSTISSVNDLSRPMSPARSEIVSPVPSRLSYLTSLLRSENINRKFCQGFYQFNPDRKKSSEMRSTGTCILPRKSFSCFSLHNPQQTNIECSQRKDAHQYKILSSASESNIKDADNEISKPITTLSPDSVHFKESKSVLYSRSGTLSPSSQLQSPYSSKENIAPLNLKPPLMKDTHKPLKKHSVTGKSKNVSLFPSTILPSNRSNSLPYLTSQRQNVPLNSKENENYSDFIISSLITPRSSAAHNHFASKHRTSPPSRNIIDGSSFPNQNFKTCDLSLSSRMSSDLDNSKTLQTNYKSFSSSVNNEELKRKPENVCRLPDYRQSLKSEASELSSTYTPLQCFQNESTKAYTMKSNYKSFAAIPTNILLQDQKAIDEPGINRTKAKQEETMETHSEMYSPALLRQQTEEVCAVIDEVLHEPLPKHKDSAYSSKMKKELKTRKEQKFPKPAGRETKYAFLQPPTKAGSQSTKPGVIRPLSLKVDIAEKNEDHYFPNTLKQFTMSSVRRDNDYKLEDDSAGR